MATQTLFGGQPVPFADRVAAAIAAAPDPQPQSRPICEGPRCGQFVPPIKVGGQFFEGKHFCGPGCMPADVQERFFAQSKAEHSRKFNHEGARSAYAAEAAEVRQALQRAKGDADTLKAFKLDQGAVVRYLELLLAHLENPGPGSPRPVLVSWRKGIDPPMAASLPRSR